MSRGDFRTASERRSMFKRLFSSGDKGDKEEKKKDDKKDKKDKKLERASTIAAPERHKSEGGGEKKHRSKKSGSHSGSSGRAAREAAAAEQKKGGGRRRKKKSAAPVNVDTSKPLSWPTTPELVLEYHNAKPFLSKNEEWLLVELNEFECLVENQDILSIIAKHSKFFEVDPPELWEEFFEYVEEMPSYDEVINYDTWQEFRDKNYPC